MSDAVAVAVTGIGVVSPLGNDAERFRDRLLAGESGAARIARFDPATLPTRIAAQAEDAGLPRLRDRKVAFALAAAQAAFADAQAHGEPLAARHGEGAGSLALGLGLELFDMGDLVDRLHGRAPAPDRHPLEVLQTPSDVCIPLIGRALALGEAPITHVSACAAGTDAVGHAFRLVRDGRRPWMLAGGADAMVNPMGVAGFCAIGALSRRNDDPRGASRPFARGRDGFLLGEGAALLLLERADDARARGARIYAEIAGYGSSLDAHGISEPHPDGDGALAAMRAAMAEAGIGPGDVAAVSAHGTGTPKNDPAEARALRRLLGARTDDVPVVATKSQIGHAIAAAGALELAALALCARSGRLPPTLNCEEGDPACALGGLSPRPRAFAGGWALKNSFGFGGQNAVLALRLPEPA